MYTRRPHLIKGTKLQDIFLLFFQINPFSLTSAPALYLSSISATLILRYLSNPSLFSLRLLWIHPKLSHLWAFSPTSSNSYVSLPLLSLLRPGELSVFPRSALTGPSIRHLVTSSTADPPAPAPSQIPCDTHTHTPSSLHPSLLL